MGANESTGKDVSFVLGENEKISVFESVKQSEDDHCRMKESNGTVGSEDQQGLQENNEQRSCPCVRGATASEIQTGTHKKPVSVRPQCSSEQQQALEQGRDKTAQRAEANNHDEEEKVKLLPADLDAWNTDGYKEVVQQYDQTAASAETNIRPLHTAPVCTGLQAKVLQCYKDHPEQTLHCSTLAKEYMTCVRQARKMERTDQSQARDREE